MREKFCPSCGKSVDKLYDGLCKDCFLDKISFIKDIPERLVIKRCKNCGRYFANEKPSSTLENAIDLSLSELLKNEGVNKANYRVEGNKVHMTLESLIEDLEKHEEKIVELVLKSIICNSCAMKKSGYFQSIIQVRAPKQLLRKIEEDIQNEANFLEKFNKTAFVSKIEKTKNGFDVYVGSKSAAIEIAKKLKNKYKAKTKISRKLSGMESGKRYYRDTILVSIGE